MAVGCFLDETQIIVVLQSVQVLNEVNQVLTYFDNGNQFVGSRLADINSL